MGESYDAVVVGSGATGGWAAKELTERGLRVALLEAGPLFPFDVDAVPAAEDLRGRQPIQSLNYAFSPSTAHLFIDDRENPYSCPEGKPFHWIRSRQVGGRLHLWGRVAMRMSDHEFKAADRDGVGEDWPISYADLAPYYDRVERFMGVCGAPEQLSQLPDGAFVPPPRLTSGEQALKSAIQRRWQTRRLTSARLAARSPDAMLTAGMRTGRLTLSPNTIASHVVVDRKTGRALGVAVVDRVTRREREVNGRVVVLCASAIESARLLLNSATPEHPDGLGNSSGALGHYLMDHARGIDFEGVAPRASRQATDEIPHGGYIPAFRNITERGVDFVRSYGVELQVFPAVARRSRRRRLRRRPQGGWYWLSAFGEVLPAFENHVSLDRTKTDAWGIPCAHIDCAYGENELAMARDEFRCVQEMVESAGFHVHKSSANLAPPGSSSHELGTARMGNDPNTSVLNAQNQSWDVKNLFVTDGACFTSGGFQNPTLTMMAITVRACDHIVDQLKRREL